MKSLDDLPTPAVLIDLDVLERNIARMQQRAREAGVALRPHAKTHKSPEVARMQLSAGARGLTLAKTSEAEVFANLGFDDIFLGYPIFGADKARRLLALADRVRLTVGVDSVEGGRSLGDVFHAAGRRLRVMLKIDCGFRRVGIEPAAAPEMARRIADLPGLELAGLFTHGGQGYGGQSPADVARVGADEGRIVTEAADAVRAAGLPVAEVSLGSTPTVRAAIGVRGVTECRPGTYVYNDRSQVALGSAALEDCAMTVLATVVSASAPDRAVVDAGSKTLSTDAMRPRADGNGIVAGRQSRIARVSEEHGVIAVAPGESFRIGERVRILPNHACVVSNLHDVLVAVRGDRVEGEIRVAARGCVQ
jgi:D-serine deaminase-like pyridoxal phosphate-dependent protein